MIIAALLARREPSFTQTNTEHVASFTASRVAYKLARSWLVEVGVPARIRLVRTHWTSEAAATRVISAGHRGGARAGARALVMRSPEN